MQLRRTHPTLSSITLLALCFLGASAFLPASLGGLCAVHALGPGSGVDVRRVLVGDVAEGERLKPAERLAWEVRKRTSIETTLAPSTARLDDPSIFRTPFLYWSSDRSFPPLSEREISGLRRFIEYGGFVLIDDAASEPGGFDASVRRELARAFPASRLERLPSAHTIHRSFYLLEDADSLEAIMHAGRAAIVYARGDLGGMWASSGGDDGSGGAGGAGRGFRGSERREQAVRLGVNLVMYALCLDYKDDQVHAPFILRRRAGRP